MFSRENICIVSAYFAGYCRQSIANRNILLSSHHTSGISCNDLFLAQLVEFKQAWPDCRWTDGKQGLSPPA
jgi:hypothetical protein